MNVEELKKILARYNLAPSKKRGQHFLINEAANEKIIHFANITKNDTIIEIGAGLGMLTQELAKKAGKVIAIEIDKGFAQILKERFKDVDRVSIVCQDILDFTPPKNIPYSVVGNLPYNISSAIIEKFLRNQKAKPKFLLIMVQKEFALRMTATVPHMNRLALLTQYYGSPAIVAQFGAHLFWPQPKVTSSLALITLKKHSALLKKKEDEMWDIIQRAFNAPRKMLKNTVPSSIKCNLQKKRPSELSIQDWITLSNHSTS